MSEPMSDVELAEIEERCQGPAFGLERDLIAEIKRLRGELARAESLGGFASRMPPVPTDPALAQIMRTFQIHLSEWLAAKLQRTEQKPEEEDAEGR